MRVRVRVRVNVLEDDPFARLCGVHHLPGRVSHVSETVAVFPIRRRLIRHGGVTVGEFRALYVRSAAGVARVQLVAARVGVRRCYRI